MNTLAEVTEVRWIPRDDSFGARLALIRQRMGWNTKEAATECGITVQSWRNWEAGKNCQTLQEVARKIADRTACDYHWLCAGPALAPFGPDNGPDTAAATGAPNRRYPLDNVITLRRPYAAEWAIDEAEVPCGLLTPIGPQRELRMAS